MVRQELAPVEPDLVVYTEGSNQFWPADFLTTPVYKAQPHAGPESGAA